MATTQDYINQLKIDKQNLVSMLNDMGVEADNNETFTSLTPKVGKIVTDPILQDKSVEITENGTTTITADSGYNGLNNVEVTTNVAGGNSSGGEQEMNYSLEEKVIGTWVDGRPLYQKTLYFTSGWKIGGEIAMPHGIKNVDDIWLESALWRRSDNTRQNIPNEHSMVGAWGAGLYDIKDDTFTLYMGTLNNSFTIRYMYITFNYTKTTD